MIYEHSIKSTSDIFPTLTIIGPSERVSYVTNVSKTKGRKKAMEIAGRGWTKFGYAPFFLCTQNGVEIPYDPPRGGRKGRSRKGARLRSQGAWTAISRKEVPEVTEIERVRW